MKIAFACSAFPPEGANGGMATFYSELAETLANNGHEILILTLTNGVERSEQQKNLRIERFSYVEEHYANLHDLGFIPTTAWFLARATHLYKKAAACIEQFQPDIIECPENGFLGLWFDTSKIPLVVRCLCPAFQSLKVNSPDTLNVVDWHIVSALETSFLNKAHSITAPSENLAKIISQHTGIALSKFKIIRNPLSSQFLKTKDDLKELSSVSQNKENYPNLIFVGRVEKLKGCDLLVEMMPKIVSKYPKAHLTIVGYEGPITGLSTTYGDVLRDRLKEIDCLEYVSFTNSVSRSTLKNYLLAADIFVFPSRYDNSPYSCLESMSCGVPVIASAVGGIPEYIEHGVTGWLVNSEDPLSLSNAVINLASNNELRKQIATNGQQSVLNMCDPQVVAQQTSELYEQTIKDFKNSNTQNLSLTETIVKDNIVKDLIFAFDDFVNNSYLIDKINNQLDHSIRENANLAWKGGWSRGFEEGQMSLIKDPVFFFRLLGKNIISTVNRRIKNYITQRINTI
jgi:glycogen synthase